MPHDPNGSQLSFELIQRAKLLRRACLADLGPDALTPPGGQSLYNLFADNFPEEPSERIAALARHFGEER